MIPGKREYAILEMQLNQLQHMIHLSYPRTAIQEQLRRVMKASSKVGKELDKAEALTND